MAWNISDKEIDALVAKLTLREKIDMVSGNGLWRTAANYTHNIPETLMTDGTYGVRYSVEQIDGPQDRSEQLSAFLSVVNADLSRGVEGAFGTSRPATCFPNGCCYACSWDPSLAYDLGAALAAECQYFGVNILLGPGINIRRMPLGGRSYEYFSEDPFLTGDLAAELIRGMQDNGVGASLKHLACNNSEVHRTTMSSEVEERALREIYLAGFERAIRKVEPWTVMSSYNLINGVQAAENEWLLNDVLRGEWGYDGLVVSDWHGIKDRPASLRAGNDLDMPESAARKEDLRLAVEAGDVSMETLDASCRRVLELVRKARAGMVSNPEIDFDAHHELSRKVAAQSIVLLKNDGNLLPLDLTAQTKIAIVGDTARAPIFQGSGCATTCPTFEDIPFAEIQRIAPEAEVAFYDIPSVLGDDAEQVLDALAQADVVLFFGNTEVGIDGEGADREHLNLLDGQDEAIALIAARNPKTVAIIATPDAVVMPWIDSVASVLMPFYGGQGVGHAIADVISGRQNPCGKLTVTFPQKLEDVPGYLSYPGESNKHIYSEGIHVGYRAYDKRKMEPLFPFGFGLSYTSFAYDNLSCDTDRIDAGTTFTVSLDVTNTGALAGKEIVQLYARPHAPRLIRPLRELKGFTKVALEPGETKRVSITVEARDLRYFDPDYKLWLLDAGTLSIDIGASSRDIRLTTDLTVDAPSLPTSRLHIDNEASQIAENESVRAAFGEFLQTRLELNDDETERMLDYCGGSFLNLYDTVSWVAGEKITKAEMADFLETMNNEFGTAAVSAG
ncbi:beta-glucosidase [Celeribacter litoreus]|uniref:beta-glucosidase n=1 Tax=Celeribacter litoreus TaxID=2876714 RepID=UPI001CCADAEF|nr:glycoside hydrolase family 3 C-terminal domain-containing protein [Celeribacter litoreus]MCA0043716.1 glycoside hydrolase family 3 C-terminal domain-containing protein [Celeribacter litoreus]